MTTAGLLLTGGASRRLGVTKATLLLDGERLVDRATRVLALVCDPTYEVGPGIGSLPNIVDEPAGRGPLVAVAAGADVLRERGHLGAAIVLAVDTPFVDATLLRWLASHPSPASVVPRVEGMAQTLCSRYSHDALVTASALVGAGERSMRALLGAIDVVLADEHDWCAVADAHSFVDIDTVEDAVNAGVVAPR